MRRLLPAVTAAPGSRGDSTGWERFRAMPVLARSPLGQVCRTDFGSSLLWKALARGGAALVWMLTGGGCRGRGRHLIRVTARGSPEAPRCHFPTLMSLCVTRHFLMWLASKIISLLWGQGGICFSSVMIQMSLLSCHYKEAGAARLGFLEVRRGCEACPGLQKVKNNLSGVTSHWGCAGCGISTAPWVWGWGTGPTSPCPTSWCQVGPGVAGEPQPPLLPPECS